MIVGPDGWGETDTSSPPALADAQGDAALSPSSRSPMRARSGTAVEVSSGGAYAVQVASKRSAAEAHASFRTSRPNSRTSLAGASRWCAALISVLRASTTAPWSAPLRQWKRRLECAAN